MEKIKSKLPQCWNPKDKCKHLNLDDFKYRVSYTGAGKYDKDAALIRADKPIPPSCGIFYFETHIISKGRDGHIGIGLCSPTNSLSRLPGWDEHSFGYHADDGYLFKGTGGGIPYGPTFTTGDVIGCCVNFRSNTVLYTKNGLKLGEAFSGILNEPLLPSVGLRTPGEIIETNFGQKPFRFDINSYIAEEQRQFYEKIRITTLNSSFESQLPLQILQYLIHHGYAKTAISFAKSIQSDHIIQSELDSIYNRQEITSNIISGDIDKAFDIVQRFYPLCLVQNDDLHFKFRCHHFIQLVVSLTDPSVIISFGQKNFSFSDPLSSSNKQLLQDVFSLIAYKNPSESPVAYLLSQNFREKFAKEVNGAILQHLGKPKISAIEKYLKQSKVILEYLIQCDVPAAVLADNTPLFNFNQNNQSDSYDVIRDDRMEF